MVQHGIDIQEVATSVLSPRTISAALPVVFGTAAIHRGSADWADVLLKPVLCNTYAEFAEQFGEATEFGKYTLSEFARIYFGLYNMSPAVFVNVMDPETDVTAHASQDITLVAGAYTIEGDVVLASLVLKDSDDSPTYVLDSDYTAEYDEDYNVVITRIPDGDIPTDTSALHATYDTVNETPCDANDVIDSLDAIEDVYPLYSLIPGLLLAPGWSQDPTVAAALLAKCTEINSLFRCRCIVDISSAAGEAELYTDVNAWKNDNNYVDPSMIACWPMVLSGTAVQYMSSHVAGVIAQTDDANDDVPYVSPSNKAEQINGLALADGTPVLMSYTKADLLNSQGIVTALNIAGWKCWGNRTSAYPGSTDPKDTFIPVRGMFDWTGNTLVLMLLSKLDAPLNRRNIESLVASANQWLNGLIAKGAMDDASLKFLATENSTADLAAGQLTLHVYLGPPSPMEHVDLVLEYDVNAHSAVWS